MKSNVTITIGMCVRNCASTLGEAIDSVLAQDFPQELVEVIMVDDGSSDSTLSLMEEYSSKTNVRVRIFHHKWKGLGYSRNVVAKKAEGKYILWVDGDMIVSRDYLKKLFDYMKEHPQVAITKGKQALERGGNLLATLEGFSRAASKMVDYGSQKAASRAIGTGGAIYRIEAIKQAGWFDQKLKGYGEDLDIEIRIRAAGWKLATIDAKFLDYERRELTWKSLWNRYWLRGYYTRYFLRKNEGLLKHYRMLPPAAFVTGLLQANTLFRLTHMSEVFLLPIQHLFKMTAWNLGFTQGYAESN